MNFLSSASAMTSPSSAAPSESAAALIGVAKLLLTHLERGVTLDARALRTTMIASFGGSDAKGAWDWRTAYEACEAAQILFLRKFGPAMRHRTGAPSRFLAMLTNLAALLPSHTLSEKSQALQQFSTPIGLGFIASAAAAIIPGDVAPEPSAGTGLLAAHAELAGRRRVLWISRSHKLIEDAQRDWSALGQERVLITPLSRFRQSTPIRLDEGILFTTYATLRSDAREERVSGVRQIVDWLGPDFDGLIIFDESHAMQNAADVKGERGEQAPSQQGRADLRLQHALPNARVLCVSATGATTVHNLAYAQRLGLWGGAEFPFATRAKFVEAIEAGGVAAMEVLARDLTALGLYAARSLSYEGIEYKLFEHRLTPEQIRIYDAHAGAFQVIHNNLDAALQAANVTRESGTLIAKAKSAARSGFESAKQRFFNHLITAIKTLALIAAHAMRVYHLQADEGERIIGRLVSPASQAVESEVPALDPAEAFAAVLDRRTSLHLQEGLEVRRVTLMGDFRIKVSDFTGGMVDRLKVMGLVSEIIAWELRLFVPVGTNGLTILGALMEGYRLVRIAEQPVA